MTKAKTAAAAKAPGAKAASPTAKPGDDVTAEYFALSNTAVDGVHFAQGDPIIGITDRDQIALALRIGAIGRSHPGAAASPTDTAAQIDAALTAAGASDAAAAKMLLASVATVFVDLGSRMGDGAKVLIKLTKAAFDRADSEATALEEAAKDAETAAAAEDASDEVKAAAASTGERAKVAREAAEATFAAFEDAEDFAGEHAKFDEALKAAVAELGK